MIVDENGESFISVEDYAMAMVDELEQENIIVNVLLLDIKLNNK